MKLKIDTHIFTRIDIHGNIHGDDAIVLKTILDSHLDALEKPDGTPILVFDLAGAKSMDSAGLGVFITTSTQIRQRNGRVHLLNVNRHIRRLLIRTNVTSLFDLPKTLEEVLTGTH